MIVHMIGNAHLQPAGMWPLHSGKDEVLATLHAAADRCDEFPLFRFSFGEVWAYEFVQRLDPKLFKRIKKLVRRKQWSISHGFYTLTNPDTVSSEMWYQILTVGHHFCLEHFSQTPQYAVNLEAESLPESYLNQLIEAGYKGLVYYGEALSFEGVDSSIFRWQNEEGQELLCYRISPSYRTRSNELYGQIIESVESGSLTLGHTLCFYGLGDHGGGPSKENIEYILANKDSFDGSELKFSSLEDFFSDALLMSDSFPVHRGRIGEGFVGLYSTCFQQRNNRNKAEIILQQAKRICEDYSVTKRKRDQDCILNNAWADLMLSGTACFANGGYITSNETTLNALISRAHLTGEELIYDVSRHWIRNKLEDFNYQQILVFNTSDSDQERWLEVEPNLDFDEWGERCLCDEDGSVIPIQFVQPEAPNELLTRILFKANLKARECTKYHIREFSLMEERPDFVLTDEGFRLLKTTLENKHLVLRYSQRALTRISLKDDLDNNVLGRLGVSFSMFEDESDVAMRGISNFELPFCSTVESEGWSVLEEGPLMVSLVNQGMIGQSPFEWTMKLYENDERIYHSFRIHYVEREKLLQMNIQLNDNISEWEDATSFKSISRKSEKVEHPFHGWTTAKMEKNTFSIVSRDFTSFSHHTNSLCFTLLRSPKVASDLHSSRDFLASRNSFTDQGVHSFDFVMIPDSEKFDLDEELDRLKHPAVVVDRYEGMSRPSWGNSTPHRLQEANELRARKDGRMTHLD